MQAASPDVTSKYADSLDAADPLKGYREQFHIPKTEDGSDCIYLSGHSLGLQPKRVRDYIELELEGWARFGVEGHFCAKNPWVTYHKLLTEQTARLVGALPVEVVVMNSLTVNLHLMMVSFYRPTRERYKILIEAGAFPSDQYAVSSQIRFHGLDPASALIELTPRAGENCIREEDIERAIHQEGSSISLILLGGVNYATGQAFDIGTIARQGHKMGCIIGSDLAHAAGNLELNLHDANVDFAVWCSYKYLNGGPGAVGACFVHERHSRNHALPRFSGWWGHDEQRRFLMEPAFVPIEGAEGWQLSNAPVLSMAALRASTDIFDEVGITRLRTKSVALTDYLDFLLSKQMSDQFSIITPRNPFHRGAQISLRIPNGGRHVHHELIKRAVICDWREPDIVRVAPVPLYNTFHDVHRFVEEFTNLLA
jgi:kynureninase